MGARTVIEGLFMLWVKALHVVAMVTWFAGLFYLPRLFVYHADTNDEIGVERFKIMERRLFILMSIGATATIVLGLLMIILLPDYLHLHWLQLKLVLVAILIGYHLYCYKLLSDFRANANRRSAKWFRAFNEAPSLLLLGIVLLAVAKPF
jgi:putative membrane protein